MKLTRKEASEWREIDSTVLSPDGQWFVYTTRPAVGTRGEISVIVRGLRGDVERRYTAGDARVGVGRLQLSPTGHWIAFQTMDGVCAVELETGRKIDFPGVAESTFAPPRIDGATVDWLLLQSKDNTALLNLGSGEIRDLQAIRAFAFDPSGESLALVGSAGLRRLDLSTGRLQLLHAEHGENYSALTWSEQGGSLAVRAGIGSSMELLLFSGFGGGKPSSLVLKPAAWRGFPPGYGVVADMRWRADERGLFFSIRREVVEDGGRSSTRLSVWHAKDEALPDEKVREAARPRTDWCFVSMRDGKFVRLGDDNLRHVQPQLRGDYALGYDLNEYGWMNRLKGGSGSSQLRDYYLISLATGKRKPLVSKLSVVTLAALSIQPMLSMDGTIFLYQDGNGNYIARDVSNSTERNLTASLPTSFYFAENAPASGRQLRGGIMPVLQGWTKDGAFILVSDNFDVWALPVKPGGRARNLTVNGRHERIWYSVRSLVLGRRTSILGGSLDLGKPLYFSGFDFASGRRGLYRYVPGAEGLQVLNEEYSYVEYYEADASNVHIASRTSAIEPRNFYRVGQDWKLAAPITDVNPQQRRYAWVPQERYLSYKNSRGELRQALLHLPVGYDPQRRYPTVVAIYLEQSLTGHTYRVPYQPKDFVEQFLREGYAVLMPDIIPRVNEAGMAALDDVLSAVTAAADTGAVDRDKLGLFGFSYGAYEAEFIVSHTSLFKAALAWAGTADLWSAYGAVYGGWMPSAVHMESGQPYLKGPWWENWDAFIANSPLSHIAEIRTPLMLVHGEKDTAVPFSQSVSLFNNLRRLGKKDVVLIQYAEEDHELSDAVMPDFMDRTSAFFGHFLQGAPAPGWWESGASFSSSTLLTVSEDEGLTQ